MMNFLLRWMLQRADITDLYSLADPERCKRQIVVASDALDKLFVKVAVRPQKDPSKGVLQFQSIEGFQKGMPDDLREKQKGQCVELAFFQIRIFQILGALALSVLDSEIPESDLLEEAAAKKPTEKAPVFLRGVPFQGGALSERRSFQIRNDNQALLNRYLVEPYSNDETTMKFKDYSFRIPHDTLQAKDSGGARVTRPEPQPQIVYPLKVEERDSVLLARLELSRSGEEQVVGLSDFQWDGRKLSISKIERKMKPSFMGDEPKQDGRLTLPGLIQEIFSEVAKQVLPAPKFSPQEFFKQKKQITSISLTGKETAIQGTKLSFLAGQEKTDRPILMQKDVKKDSEGHTKTIILQAPVKFEEVLPTKEGDLKSQRVVVELTKLTTIPAEAKEGIEIGSQFKTTKFVLPSEASDPISEAKGQTMPQQLQSVFEQVFHDISDETSVVGGIKQTKKGFPIPQNSDRIPENLRIKKLWENLAKDPPIKSFCVARALQLLSSSALQRSVPEVAQSSVCRTKFLLQKEGGVPVPDESIANHPGVQALAQLFVETLENGIPRIAESEKYRSFLRNMKQLFQKEATFEETTAPNRLLEIQEKKPFFCPSGDQIAQIRDPALIRALRDKATGMIRRQIKHTSDVMILLKQLFVIEKSTPLRLQPAVLKEGLPRIDAVAIKARELLMTQYSECETMYREGLLLIAGKKESVKFPGANVPAPSAPPAGANTHPANEDPGHV